MSSLQITSPELLARGPAVQECNNYAQIKSNYIAMLIVLARSDVAQNSASGTREASRARQQLALRLAIVQLQMERLSCIIKCRHVETYGVNLFPDRAHLCPAKCAQADSDSAVHSAPQSNTISMNGLPYMQIKNKSITASRVPIIINCHYCKQ